MSTKKQVSCPFCSLLCTDIHISFDGGRLAGFTPACSLGEAGFLRAAADLSAELPAKAHLETALRTARTWLRDARQPLVVLSGSLENEAISAAIRLAKYYTAILACDEDWSGSVLSLSMQAEGLLTGTLGDLRGISLVVRCGVDPTRTAPRLGVFLGRDLATDSLYLDPPDPLEALRWLRIAYRGETGNIPTNYAGTVARIGAAPSGLVIFGPEWLRAGQFFATELFLWLKDLNRQKRWYALYLSPAPNSTGVVEALLSETGCPGNLRFGSNGIDYSPRLWRAEQIIQQGEADLCLLVGQPASFSEKTLALLSKTRTILLDPAQPTWNPTVWLQSTQPGVDVSGHLLRLDGVPVEMQPCLPGHRFPMKNLLVELTQ